MIFEHRPTRVRDQSLQREDQQEQIVDFAEKWDVIRNEIDRQQNVPNCAGHEQLVGVRDATIGEQSPEEAQEIR